MKPTSLWVLSLAIVLLFNVAVACAQGTSSPEDEAMNTLRVGIPREQDNVIVDNWLNKQLRDMRAKISTPILIPEAVREFRTRIDAQYNNPENTAEFKQKIAERIGAVFAAEFTRGTDLSERAAWAMARVVLSLENAATLDAALAGLKSKDQVVRFLSAQALVKLQPAISADQQKVSQVLAALAEAGTQELNGVALANMYAAAAFENHVPAAVPVILQIFDARLERRREAVGEIDRAEVPAITYLDAAEQAGRLDSAMRTQVVQRLAPLLRILTERYAVARISESEKAAIAETILVTENLLKKITKPEKAPDISREMQTAGADPAINMQIELIQWIGSPEVPGVLSKDPWNVPVGAP